MELKERFSKRISSHSHACGICAIFVIHPTLTWTTGPLTCLRDLLIHTFTIKAKGTPTASQHITPTASHHIAGIASQHNESTHHSDSDSAHDIFDPETQKTQVSRVTQAGIEPSTFGSPVRRSSTEPICCRRLIVMTKSLADVSPRCISKKTG